MKKLFALFLSLSMIIGIFAVSPIYVMADSKYGDFSYVRTGANTAEITKYSGTGFDITIPGQINGLTITGIGDYSFSYNKRITSVIIPDSVTYIGKEAFDTCRSLSYIKFPSNLSTIADCAFYDNAFRSVEIPNGCVSIGSGAFANCENLKKIIIPTSVNSIGNQCFTCSSSMSFTSYVIITVYGNSGSYAEKYARYCGAKFKNLNRPDEPEKASISSVKNNKRKQVKLKLNQISNANYIIAYSTKKSKLKKVSKGTTFGSDIKFIRTSKPNKTIKKLKSKKKYYFKTCAYRTYYNTNDNVFYVFGNWSGIKSKKIK